MPKVAITQQQKYDQQKEATCSAILKALMAKNGETDQNKKDFAKQMGRSPGTWINWKQSNLKTAKLWDVLDAAQKVGVKITINVE